jgi:hypothetical protein
MGGVYIETDMNKLKLEVSIKSVFKRKFLNDLYSIKVKVKFSPCLIKDIWGSGGTGPNVLS